MHIISKTALRKFWEKHNHAETALRYWYKITSQSRWSHFDDVRQTFPSADNVGQLTVMNKYIELLQKFPPRPVVNEAEFEATQSVINQLLDKPELSPEEEDYLDVLVAV